MLYMQALLTRYYRLIFPVLIIAIAGFAFYCGILQGRREGSGTGISLQCSDSILSKLAIPTEARAAGKEDPQILGAATSSESHGAYAGSKNGTKYYTPGCAALDRIKPENMVWFDTVEDATLQGYTAGNC